MTSRAEIALRDVVDSMLRRAFGPSWWPSAMRGKLDGIRKEAERQATRAGATTPSSREFLDYTYLRDLKEIVRDHWEHLGSVWADQSSFESKLSRLNVLRRSEAHNRTITEQELVELEAIHDWMLDAIATVYPDVVPGYLVEKWRLSLLKVAEKLRDSWGPGPVRRDDAENVRRLADFHRAAREAAQDLRDIRPPPGKQQLHDELRHAVDLAITSSDRIRDSVRRSDIRALEHAADEFNFAMQGIREFEEAFLLVYSSSS